MPFFSPDETSPEHDFIPGRLVFEGPWGEVWRCFRNDSSRAILVAYTTTEGDEIFNEILPVLRQWKSLADNQERRLLKIYEICESAPPYLLVEDTGGETVREIVLGRSEPPKLEALGRLGLILAEAMQSTEAYRVSPLGISPDTVWLSPDDRETPWRLLPTIPGTRLQQPLLAEGRYSPPELSKARDLVHIHADSYGIATLLIDVFRRDFSGERPDLKDAIPYRGLRTALENCLISKDGGGYSEPTQLVMGLDRWVRAGIKADMREFAEAEKKRKQSPIARFFSGKGKTILIGAVALLSFGVFGVAGYYLTKAAPAMLVVKSDEDPGETTDLYLQALMAGEPAKALQLCTADADPETREAAKILRDLETSGRIGQFSSATANISGFGKDRAVEARLRDQNEKEFALLRLELSQIGGTRWRVLRAWLHVLPAPVAGNPNPATTNGDGA